jgi:hypothetical protein
MRILYRIYKIHHEEKRGVFGFFFVGDMGYSGVDISFRYFITFFVFGVSFIFEYVGSIDAIILGGGEQYAMGRGRRRQEGGNLKLNVKYTHKE